MSDHVPMDIHQAAELTGYSARTLYTYGLDGRVPVHKPTGGKLVFFRDELLEFLDGGKRKTSRELADEATALLARMGGRGRRGGAK